MADFIHPGDSPSSVHFLYQAGFHSLPLNYVYYVCTRLNTPIYLLTDTSTGSIFVVIVNSVAINGCAHVSETS